MVSDFVIDTVFDKIWSFWPNREKGDKAPRKAVSVVLKSGHNKEKVIEACRIYSLLHEGDEPQYVKQLNNFLNEDLWLDVYESHSLEALEKQRQEALDLIDAWNQKCRKHWCKVEGIDSRVPIAKRALLNQDFKNNWKKALDKASQIFYYNFNEADPRSKVILSFSWFTNVSPSKHVVVKIIEGEYGNAPKETRFKQAEVKEVNWDERKKAAELFKQLRNGDTITEDPPSSEEKSQTDDPYGFH